MKRTLLFIALMSATIVKADGLQISLTSYHFDDDYEYNEINPGLIYEHDINDSISIIGGTYKNSFDETSALVGIEAQYGYMGVQGGFATGYERLFGNKYQFVGSAFAEVEVIDGFYGRLTYIPGKKGGALGTSIVKRW